MVVWLSPQITTMPGPDHPVLRRDDVLDALQRVVGVEQRDADAARSCACRLLACSADAGVGDHAQLDRVRSG